MFNPAGAMLSMFAPGTICTPIVEKLAADCR
jgi:hypothetical protein